MNKFYTLILSIFMLANVSLFAQVNNGTKIEVKTKKESAEQPVDSFAIENKISYVYNDGEQYFVKLQLKEAVDVKIEIYNMLAKPVKTVYDGKASTDPDRIYDFNASTLPNGIYFAILQGNGFRYPYKFTIRR